MFIRKASDGNYYVCRIARRPFTKGGRYQDRLYKNTFFITKSQLFRISFPKEFQGKTIRLKVEVVN